MVHSSKQYLKNEGIHSLVSTAYVPDDPHVSNIITDMTHMSVTLLLIVITNIH